jgi:hypothetical protein
MIRVEALAAFFREHQELLAGWAPTGLRRRRPIAWRTRISDSGTQPFRMLVETRQRKDGAFQPSLNTVFEKEI